MKTGIRSIDEPNWAPPGGTSSDRCRQLASSFNQGLLDRLVARATDDRLWVKLDPGGSARVGWKDDPRGGYYVGFGLEHNPYRAEDQLRSFLWLQYRHEDANNHQDREDRVGEVWLEAPYARDIELHLDLMFGYLAAHRRTLTSIEPQCRDCDHPIVPDATVGWRHDAPELDNEHSVVLRPD